MALEDYLEKEQPPQLVVNTATWSTLLDMSRWTKFLAILGFIFLSLMLIGGALLGFGIAFGGYAGNPVLASFGAIGYFMLYLLIAAIDFYPVYALLKYSTNMRAALHNNNQEQFDMALRYLRNMYKYLGVLVIIVIGLYALMFTFLLLMAAIK